MQNYLKRDSRRYLHCCVHCSIIHNVEAIQVSTDKWKNKQNVYTAIKYDSAFKMVGNSDICYNMNEHWGRVAM